MAARLLAWAVAVTIVTTGNALSRYSALFPNGVIIRHSVATASEFIAHTYVILCAGNRVPCPADVDQSTCSAGTGGMLLCPGEKMMILCLTRACQSHQSHLLDAREAGSRCHASDATLTLLTIMRPSQVLDTPRAEVEGTR